MSQVQPVTLQVCAVLTMSDGSTMEMVTEELDAADPYGQFVLGLEHPEPIRWGALKTIQPGPTYMTVHLRAKRVDAKPDYIYRIEHRGSE